ncbi:MAG: DUF2798 domain-containing protein [Butyrivibrio sp.]|nr:DUF2798 domain-containing protein [Butyrivibrio sp.]
MPKTKLENFIFTVVMAFIMVYGMICYNISINIGGCNNSVFLMAFSELKIMWPIAIILELFVVGRIAPMLAFSFMKPTDRPQFITYAISFCICALMCPLMSLIATFLFKEPSLGTYAQTWAMNVPAAYAMQFLIAGPLVRFLFRAVFRRNESGITQKKAAA